MLSSGWSVPSGAILTAATPVLWENAMKFIWAIILALSLIASPSAARLPASTSCMMPGAVQGMAADHENMDCCTPDCATPCPPAMLPLADLVYEPEEPIALVDRQSAADHLPSIKPWVVDPPPRPFFA